MIKNKEHKRVFGAVKGRASRRATLGALVATSVLALGLGGGVGAAFAEGSVGTFDEGHVDFVNVGLNDVPDAFTLGSNVDGVACYPEDEIDASGGQPDWDLTVSPSAKNKVTTDVWTIPDNLEDAEEWEVVYAGFSGVGEEESDCADTYGLLDYFSVNDQITLTVCFDGPGDVTLTFPPATGVGVTGDGECAPGDPYELTFTLAAGDESFHAHPQWDFTAAGEYHMFVTANANSGIAATGPVDYEICVLNNVNDVCPAP